MVFFEEINHRIYVLKRGAKVITLPSEIIGYYSLKTIINYFKYFSQRAIIQAVILIAALPLIAQDRAVWVTAWDLNSPAKIDKMIDDMQSHGFNKLFVQTRYRGDALYIPNRIDSTYSNTESRCYLLSDDGFDPLAYTIEKAKPKGLKVYAWVTTFVATPHDLSKIDSTHVFYRHPEWFLRDRSGKPIAFNEYEGAFLDPSLPEVRDYTLNILADIVVNYDIDGLQLDYIRYPDSIFGWNSLSKMLSGSLIGFDFGLWKQSKINSFVNLTYITLKNIKPELEISASVISDRNKALNKYSQNWLFWLEEGYIDRVYVMAYNTSNTTFGDLIKRLNSTGQKHKMTIIVRAWQEGRSYHFSQINDKLGILKMMGFKDIGYYNYAGLINQGYLKHIKF